jgi:hypothetical protein
MREFADRVTAAEPAVAEPLLRLQQHALRIRKEQGVGDALFLVKIYGLLVAHDGRWATRVRGVKEENYEGILAEIQRVEDLIAADEATEEPSTRAWANRTGSWCGPRFEAWFQVNQLELWSEIPLDQEERSLLDMMEELSPELKMRYAMQWSALRRRAEAATARKARSLKSVATVGVICMLLLATWGGTGWATLDLWHAIWGRSFSDEPLSMYATLMLFAALGMSWFAPLIAERIVVMQRWIGETPSDLRLVSVSTGIVGVLDLALLELGHIYRLLPEWARTVFFWTPIALVCAFGTFLLLIFIIEALQDCLRQEKREERST